MTHDELLEMVKFRLECAELKYLQEEAPSVRALLSVVEFHKPICDDPNCCINQGGCECGEDFYPCRTIQAIEKELV